MRTILGVEVATNMESLVPIPVRSMANLQELLAAFCRVYGVSIEEMVRRNNSAILVDLRRAFAEKAREQGYSFPTIGRAIHRHHTTVIALLKKEKPCG